MIFSLSDIDSFYNWMLNEFVHVSFFVAFWKGSESCGMTFPTSLTKVGEMICALDLAFVVNNVFLPGPKYSTLHLMKLVMSRCE